MKQVFIPASSSRFSKT